MKNYRDMMNPTEDNTKSPQSTKDQTQPSSTPEPTAAPQTMTPEQKAPGTPPDAVDTYQSMTPEQTKAGNQPPQEESAYPEKQTETPGSKTPNAESAYQSQTNKDGAVYQSKADTNLDRVVDQAEPPAKNLNVDTSGKAYELVQEPTSPKMAAERIVELDKEIAETKQNLTNIEQLIKEKSEAYNNMPADDWASKSPLIIELGKLDTQRNRLKDQQNGCENRRFGYAEKFNIDINKPTQTDDQDTNPKNTTTNETPIDTKTDVKEPPAEDKKDNEEEYMSSTTPGDAENRIKQENTQADEKTTNGEKTNAEEVPENEFKSPGDIQSQIQDIFPEYNPEDPASKELLENLKNNPDQTNAVSDALKLAGDQKTALEKTVSENPDLLKNLGIKDFSDIMKSTAIDTIKNISSMLETGIKELAGKTNPTKEEEDKKKRDGIIFILLQALAKALGTVLVVGGTAALAAGKEMKK